MGSVLALGAWLKNAACVRAADGRVRWSPLHGDLGTPQARAALDASAEALIAVEDIAAVAHDLHPDFHSTRLALALAGRLGVPAVGVQHHHAHVGAVMAEHGLAEPVVGLALDGVGLGTDGTAWGGEVLVVEPGAWRRVGHLQPLRLPGGDVAAREPWRLAAAALHAMGRGGEIEARFGPAVGAPLARGVAALLDKRLNSPLTTSAGRWFDAAAGALGLAVRQSHEAEAAMALEAAAVGEVSTAGLVAVERGVIDLRPVLARLFDGDAQGAARFHAVLAESLAEAAHAAARDAGTRRVVLGGGCFFNRVLSARLAAALVQRGLVMHRPLAVSAGDAGLALGQAWVAAHTRIEHPEETRACA
jgi:hydrogenase maturation protein HypF